MKSPELLEIAKVLNHDLNDYAMETLHHFGACEKFK
jgi:hypothetical protein